jgi:hypothetical protein
MLTPFVALLGGLVGLAGGAMAGGLAGSAIAAATHMSSFEGAAGYFVVFVCAPLGALAGLPAGVWLALRLRGGRRGVVPVVLYSGLTVGVVVAGAAAVIMTMLALDETLNRNAAPLQALFEIRLPPGKRLAEGRRSVEIELDTHRNTAPAFLHDAWPLDGDRLVISGGVELAFRSAERLLVLKIKGEPDRLFRLELPGKPAHSDAFGSWHLVDFVGGAGERPRKATAADQYEIRYRVRDPNVEFSRPIVAFELSLPASTVLPSDPQAIAVRAEEAENTMKGGIQAESISREADRVTLPGTVQLAGDTHSLLAITLPDQPTRLFDITLPRTTWLDKTLRHATRTSADDRPSFGPWQRVGLVRDASAKQARVAPPEDDARLRYRLR